MDDQKPDREATCYKCKLSYRWTGEPDAGKAACSRCGRAIRNAGRQAGTGILKWIDEAPNQEKIPEKVAEPVEEKVVAEVKAASGKTKATKKKIFGRS